MLVLVVLTQRLLNLTTERAAVALPDCSTAMILTLVSSRGGGVPG